MLLHLSLAMDDGEFDSGGGSISSISGGSSSVSGGGR